MKTKTCCKCKTPKELKDFGKDQARPDGLHGECRVCSSQRASGYRAKNPGQHQKIGDDGLTNKQRWAAKNPEHYKTVGEDGLTYHQRRYRNNPGRERERQLRVYYGITLEIFGQMLSEQGNACAICRGADKKWCVDHDHATGKVRSILCRNCNLALGNLGDSAKIAAAATAYLIKHGNPL